MEVPVTQECSLSRAGFSQTELAQRTGTSQSTIAWLDSGQTLPSTKTICATSRRPAANSGCGYPPPDAAFTGFLTPPSRLHRSAASRRRAPTGRGRLRIAGR
ncbi:hypothetical protein XH80_40135 [Bradyrhizobium sp. CCBAU 45384]|nr:hypothetical protein [Bradyrhizobium sp. CCBAU 45384]